MNIFRATALILGALALCGGEVRAQHTTIVVPYPPGGPTDVVARIMSKLFSDDKNLDRTFIVMNKVGGEGGTLGTTEVAEAKADERKLLMGPSSALAVALVLNNPKPSYTLDDFTPLCGIARFGTPIVTRADASYRTLREMVASARADAGKLSVAYTNPATLLVIRQLEKREHIALNAIRYKGDPQALADLRGGQVNAAVLALGTIRPQVESGDLRALAVTTEKHSGLLPGVPTVAEAGVNGWRPFLFWVGLFAPKNLPLAEATAISKACVSAAQTAEVRKTLSAGGLEPMDSAHVPAEGFAQFTKSQLEYWRSISLEQ